MRTVKLFGIPNCDTVKKTTTWLTRHGISFTFHDFKIDHIEEARFDYWVQQAGLDRMINKRSTTYRELSEADKAKLSHPDTAYAVVRLHTSIIKRPVLEIDGKLASVGFDIHQYKTLLSV